MTDIVSVNPATLAENGRVKASTPDDVRAAVGAARAAQAAWAARSLDERGETLERFARLLLAEKREIAALVTAETGKPIPEATAADLLPVLETVDWLRNVGRGVLEDERFRNRIIIAKNRTSRVRRVPRGVVGIIGAWNYPFGLPGSTALFALYAGNAVVLKPSELTPLAGAKLAELLHRAGVPEDAMRVVQGPGATAGDALARAPIDFLHFTGSVATGETVDAACRANRVPTCLELGGSDPAIVLEDADLDLAANGVAWGRFANAGQTCAAVKRVFVVESVAERFTTLLVDKVRRLRVGNGAEPGVDVGPLIDARAVRKMEEIVADALARGARVAVGGERAKSLPGHFFQPTILVDVPPDARVLREEVFGPVLPVVAVPDEAAAIARANDTEFGLSASVWSRDIARAERVAERIQAGTVTVNDGVYTYALVETPWLGWKRSGQGASHHAMGLLAMTRAQHINVTPNARPVDQLWWFPYGDSDADTWARSLDFLYGGAAGKAANVLPVAAEMLRKKNL